MNTKGKILAGAVILIGVSLLLNTLISCATTEWDKKFEKLQNAEIFTVSEDEKSVTLDGVINSTAFNKFKKIMDKHPDIKKINIKICEGSIDDEINLKLAKFVYEKGLDTHLMTDGVVASGGTDFFLAGKKRTRGKNTKFGVHSWASGDIEGKMETAKDFPREHESHQPYIKYYESIGFTPQKAEDFYFFTINSAPARDMYWMNAEEIKKYQITTE